MVMDEETTEQSALNSGGKLDHSEWLPTHAKIM